MFIFQWPHACSPVSNPWCNSCWTTIKSGVPVLRHERANKKSCVIIRHSHAHAVIMTFLITGTINGGGTFPKTHFKSQIITMFSHKSIYPIMASSHSPTVFSVNKGDDGASISNDLLVTKLLWWIHCWQREGAYEWRLTDGRGLRRRNGSRQNARLSRRRMDTEGDGERQRAEETER